MNIGIPVAALRELYMYREESTVLLEYFGYASVLIALSIAT